MGNGSEIGNNSIIDDKSVLESRVKIGVENLIIYSAQICCDVVIGNNCVIGGFIGERTIIGNDCRIFESHTATQYPATGGDGIHYWFKEGTPVAQNWAKEVFADFMRGNE